MQSFFVESQIGDFTLYITDQESADKCTDPFNYTLLVSIPTQEEIEETKAEDKPVQYIKYKRTLCNNIPCQMCQLQQTCKNGEHKTKAIVEYVIENMPELQI